IVAALDEQGHSVTVCDRLRSGEKWRNIAKRKLAEVVAPEQLSDWLERPGRKLDAVVHMGAISSTTETDADLIMENNFRLSQMLWSWCVRSETPLIYASSAATYGDGSLGFDDDPSLEAHAALRPLNAYGWSKTLFDRWALQLVGAGEAAPPQWVGLKFFNVYGPNEYHKGSMQSVISQKHQAAAAGRPVTLFRSHNSDYPDGGQRRDFVWVGDCVDVVLWMLEHPNVNGIFDLGTGVDRTFEDLAKALIDAVGSASQIEIIDMPEAIRDRYQYFTRASMERLRAAGYEIPFTNLEDGVRAYVRDFLSTDDPYR
ncbi:MAG: ADP-glyceromanno-heptose 6-epimerase, partial [bacterium]|nr:ADP-glyceromanno-heptose 6-epimerase [bacterium]